MTRDERILLLMLAQDMEHLLEQGMHPNMPRVEGYRDLAQKIRDQRRALKSPPKPQPPFVDPLSVKGRILSALRTRGPQTAYALQKALKACGVVVGVETVTARARELVREGYAHRTGLKVKLKSGQWTPCFAAGRENEERHGNEGTDAEAADRLTGGDPEGPRGGAPENSGVGRGTPETGGQWDSLSSARGDRTGLDGWGTY